MFFLSFLYAIWNYQKKIVNFSLFIKYNEKMRQANWMKRIEIKWRKKIHFATNTRRMGISRKWISTITMKNNKKWQSLITMVYCFQMTLTVYMSLCMFVCDLYLCSTGFSSSGKREQQTTAATNENKTKKIVDYVIKSSWSDKRSCVFFFVYVCSAGVLLKVDVFPFVFVQPHWQKL